MMGLMKYMKRRQDWMVKQTQMMHELLTNSFKELNVDTSAYQWADWNSDEWMDSEEEEEEEDEGEEEEEEWAGAPIFVCLYVYLFLFDFVVHPKH